MITSQSGLGWNPLHAVAKVAKAAVKAPVSVVKAVTITPITATARAASQVAHGNVRAAFKTTVLAPVSTVKTIATATKDTILIPTVFAAEITKAATLLALRPVTSRIKTLENRRAVKIAWDKRKSKTPTPADRAEAKSWTKAKLNKELPHGPLLAFLAGAPTTSNLGAASMSTELGVAPAVIAALVPVFIAIMNSLLTRLSKSGEAPVSIGPNGQPILPPGMDPTQPDPNADAAAAAEAAQAPAGPPDGPLDAGDAPDAGGGMSPHGGKPNNTMLIGGAAVGLVLLVLLLKPKSGGDAKKK